MYKFSLRLTIPSSLNTTELHDVMKDFLIQLYQSSKVIGHSGQENSSNLYLLPVLSPLGEYRHCCSYIFCLMAGRNTHLSRTAWREKLPR